LDTITVRLSNIRRAILSQEELNTKNAKLDAEFEELKAFLKSGKRKVYKSLHTKAHRKSLIRKFEK